MFDDDKKGSDVARPSGVNKMVKKKVSKKRKRGRKPKQDEGLVVKKGKRPRGRPRKLVFEKPVELKEGPVVKEGKAGRIGEDEANHPFDPN